MAQILVEHTEIDRPNSSASFNDIYTHTNSSVIDLYSVGDEDKGWMSLKEKEVPFMHWIWLHGPQGEVVRVNALFDGGAMVVAMCSSIFDKVKHCLHSQAKPSSRLLRMANRIAIQSQAVWKGMLELKGVCMEGEFEVFDSGRGWKFLFGKPLLRHFQAVHDYSSDMVSIRAERDTATLHSNATQVTSAGNCLTSNVEQRESLIGGSSSVKPPSRQVSHMGFMESMVQNDESGFISGCIEDMAEGTTEDITATEEDVVQKKESDMAEENEIVERDTFGMASKGEQRSACSKKEQEEEGTNQGGDVAPPSREVLSYEPTSMEAKESDEFHSEVAEYVIDIAKDLQSAGNVSAGQSEMPWVVQEGLSGGSREPPSRGVPTWPTNLNESTPTNMPCLVLPVTNIAETSPEEAIFTRHTEPFLPAHIVKILDLVQIGEDVTEAQHDEVKGLISEFANCFALSLIEVNFIPGMVHKLNIPENTTFHTKIPQRSFNPDQ